MLGDLMDWSSIDRIWFLTWTAYGTWLPGDERGFVSPKFEGASAERNNEPGRPYDDGRRDLPRIAESKLSGDPVRLTRALAEVVRRQFEETARIRGWQLLAGAIMANHIHLVVGVPGDPDPSVLLRDFKSYASRDLNHPDRVSARRRWWTGQGSNRKLGDWDTLETVLWYVREQEYALEFRGRGEPRRPGERGALAKGRQGAHAPLSPDGRLSLYDFPIPSASGSNPRIESSLVGEDVLRDALPPLVTSDRDGPRNTADDTANRAGARRITDIFGTGAMSTPGLIELPSDMIPTLPPSVAAAPGERGTLAPCPVVSDGDVPASGGR